MSNGSELKSRAAHALRAAGFRPLPRWWAKAEDLELIHYMVSKYSDEVNRIRAEANQSPLSDERRKQQEIDAAWSRMKGGR